MVLRYGSGHALNKVLKDFILKYELLRGKAARYVPGWDCHGLPIELKVLQAMTDQQRRDLNTIKLRRKARDFALKAVNQQRQGFKRYAQTSCWLHQRHAKGMQNKTGAMRAHALCVTLSIAKVLCTANCKVQ